MWTVTFQNMCLWNKQQERAGNVSTGEDSVEEESDRTRDSKQDI